MNTAKWEQLNCGRIFKWSLRLLDWNSSGQLSQNERSQTGKLGITDIYFTDVFKQWIVFSVTIMLQLAKKTKLKMDRSCMIYDDHSMTHDTSTMTKRNSKKKGCKLWHNEKDLATSRSSHTFAKFQLWSFTASIILVPPEVCPWWFRPRAPEFNNDVDSRASGPTRDNRKRDPLLARQP